MLYLGFGVLSGAGCLAWKTRLFKLDGALLIRNTRFISILRKSHFHLRFQRLGFLLKYYFVLSVEFKPFEATLLVKNVAHHLYTSDCLGNMSEEALGLDS